MPTINLKFTLFAIFLIGIVALVMRYDYVVEQNKKLTKEKITLEANAAEKDRVATLTDNARIDANQKLEAAKDEIKKRDDCIASGDCKRVVRVKSTCAVPQTETSSGVTEGYAELAPSVQRAATDFEYKLAEQESKLELCLSYARGVSITNGNK